MSQQPPTITERMLGVAALASLTAGLIAGIGARIIMRIVALTAHMPPGFSIAGTLNIVLNGTFLGLVAGFIMLMVAMIVDTSAKARKYFPGPILRGLLCGTLLLLVIGLPLLLAPSSPTDDLNLGIPLLNRVMFGALFIIYGLTLGVADKIFDRFLPRRPTSAKPDIASPAE